MSAYCQKESLVIGNNVYHFAYSGDDKVFVWNVTSGSYVPYVLTPEQLAAQTKVA